MAGKGEASHRGAGHHDPGRSRGCIGRGRAIAPPGGDAARADSRLATAPPTRAQGAGQRCASDRDRSRTRKHGEFSSSTLEADAGEPTTANSGCKSYKGRECPCARNRPMPSKLPGSS